MTKEILRTFILVILMTITIPERSFMVLKVFRLCAIRILMVLLSVILPIMNMVSINMFGLIGMMTVFMFALF